MYSILANFDDDSVEIFKTEYEETVLTRITIIENEKQSRCTSYRVLRPDIYVDDDMSDRY